MIQDEDQAIDESTFVAEPADDPTALMRQAREMIPVGNRGIAPMNSAQAIDFARDLVKAKYSIPDHMKGNVGDMLTLIDLGLRVNMAPNLIAAHTYVQNGKLCFESQLYHAFASASGLLRGDLSVEYEGDGDDLVCIVSGYLRNDPLKRIHRSERLKDAHPGHVEKTVDGVKKTFVKGSPLWDRKPKVQLFYDTSRDWVRIYCPRATLGIYTPDEIEEYGPEFARDVTPPGLNSRLAIAPKSDEGHAPGHAEAELSQIAPNVPAPAGAGRAEGAGKGRAPELATRRVKRTTDVPKGGKKRTKAETKPKKPAKKEAAEPSMEKIRLLRAAGDLEKDGPKTVRGYLAWAALWINDCKDIDEMGNRWKQEMKLRNQLGITEDDRAPLLDLIAKRREELTK